MTEIEQICGTCYWCREAAADDYYCHVNPPQPTGPRHPIVGYTRPACRHWRKGQQQASEPWDNEPPTPDAEPQTPGRLIRVCLYEVIAKIDRLPASEARSIVQAYASDLMNRLQDIP